jgi:hypothetical protein
MDNNQFRLIGKFINLKSNSFIIFLNDKDFKISINEEQFKHLNEHKEHISHIGVTGFLDNNKSGDTILIAEKILFLDKV